MPSYKLSPNAEADLDRIFDFGIDTFGLDQAIAYMGKLKNRFEDIAESPFHYPSVEHIRVGYRRSVCGVHSIYFRIHSGEVEIMRLINREDTTDAF